MARYAFEDPMASSSSGGWKSLFYFAVAAAGLGFAGYVYLVPYSKMERAVGSGASAVVEQQRTAAAAVAERDKLKADLAKFTSAASDKAAAEAKQKATITALSAQLKPGLEALGATVAGEDTVLTVSFPAAKLIDANGIDVSDGGMAAVKILAEAAKKESAKVRIRAKSSSAPPPKELRSLFRTAGEMNAVRAARVMSSLQSAGVQPSRVTIVGDADKSASPRPAKGKKGAAAPSSDRVELELEPGE
jgi:hypothetical protein